jgi:hypothetical protein
VLLPAEEVKRKASRTRFALPTWIHFAGIRWRVMEVKTELARCLRGLKEYG